jgi:cytochrome c
MPGWARVIKGVALAAALAVAGSIVPPASAQDAKTLAAGKAILEQQCARCHATGVADASPLDQAPPFRDLHKKYPVAQLAEALAEGITTGHAEMPEFVFEPAEIEAILAYLESLGGQR